LAGKAKGIANRRYRAPVELGLWGQESRATTDALKREASAVEAYLAAD
jgi:hypothetical protein